MNILDEKLVKCIFDFSYNNQTLWTILLANFKRVETDKIPTISSRIKGKCIELLYNKKFIEEAELYTIKTLLLHEAIHLIYRHEFRCLQCDTFVLVGSDKNLRKEVKYTDLTEAEKLLVVKAADLAKDFICNRDLVNVLPSCNREVLVLANKFGVNADGLSTELMVKNIENMFTTVLDVQSSGGSRPFGSPKEGKVINDHNQSSDCSETEQRIKQKMVENAVKRAVNQNGKGYGSLPGDLSKELDVIFAPPAIDWKSMLANLVKCSIPKSATRTWAHINRRVPYLMKGRKPKRVPCIAVAVDTSGSISDFQLQSFLSEINHLRKVHSSDVEIVQCDTQINSSVIVSYKQKLPNVVVGRGGTYLKPVFEWFDKDARKPDVLIVFSDLEVNDDDVPSEPKAYNVIWVVTSESQCEHFSSLNRYGSFIPMLDVEEIENEK